MSRVLLTGASGWFGQSFIGNYVLTYGEDRARTDLVLVTSDGREISNPLVVGPLETHTFGQVLDAGHDISTIVQSAFLTRDKIGPMGERRYRDINGQIIRSLGRLLLMYPRATTYLISSGAVAHDSSAYGALKAEEESVVLEGGGGSLVFRVYGAHGRFCGYRDWSAFCDFGRQALRSGEIVIRSRSETVRGFVSFDQLAQVILRLIERPSSVERPGIVDAVAEVVELRSLAAAFVDHFKVGLSADPPDRSIHPDVYTGDPGPFRDLCRRQGIGNVSVDEMVRGIKKNMFVDSYL